jgi:hypothetical protein
MSFLRVVFSLSERRSMGIGAIWTCSAENLLNAVGVKKVTGKGLVRLFLNIVLINKIIN